MQFNWSVLTGYDFFISYRRSDAASYAARLESLLRQADFRCFLDDNEASPGEPLTSRIRAGLKRSKVLILVASPEVCSSTWVAEELQIFAKTGRDIIPIDIADGVLAAMNSDERFAVLRQRDLLWLEEEATIAPPSEPSSRILGEIQKNFKHRRANRNLRVLFAVVAALLTAATAFSYWQKTVADSQRSLAEERTRLATSRQLASQAELLLNDRRLDVALLLASESLDQANTFEARRALFTVLHTYPGLLAAFGGYSRQVASVQFSPDSQTVASASWDGSIKAWNVYSHKETLEVPNAHPYMISSLSFSPDGNALASGSLDPEDNSVRLWAPKTGALIGPALECHWNGVRSVSFSPNGKLLASTTGPFQIIFWDTATRQRWGHALYSTGELNSLAFSPDSRFIAAGGEGSARVIRVWDVATQKLIATLKGHTSDVSSLAFGKDRNTLASVGWDGRVIVWDVSHAKKIWEQRQKAPNGDSLFVNAVRFTPDGTLVATAQDSSDIKFWNAVNGQLVRTLSTPASAITSLAFSSKDTGVLATGSKEGYVFLWDLRRKYVTLNEFSIPETVHIVASANGKWVAGSVISGPLFLARFDSSPTGEIQLHATDTSGLTMSDLPQQDGKDAASRPFPRALLAFDPATRYLAVYNSNQSDIRVWNLATSSIARRLTVPPDNPIWSLTFNPSGTMLVAGGTSSLLSWDATGWVATMSALHQDSKGVGAFAFSPDGTYAVFAIGNEVMSWQPTQGTTTKVTSTSSPAMTLTFNHSGSLLASAVEKDATTSEEIPPISVWSTRNKLTERLTLSSDISGYSIAYSPDDQLLLTGGMQGYCLVWDANTGQRIGQLNLLDRPLAEMGIGEKLSARDPSFTSVPNRILIRSQERKVSLWVSSPYTWRDYARHIAGRSLTASERRHYIGEE